MGERTTTPNLFFEFQFSSPETEDDLIVDYLDTINDTVTWSTDWTIESVVAAQKRSNFNTNPSFQRRDAWTDVKKSRFIESLIFGLPVPQIVLAEDKNQRAKYIVVDGKQRLLTIFSFFSENTEDAFVLNGLKDSKINGLNARQLEEKFPVLYNNLLNQSIRSIIIKNWSTENLLYTIFYRLNSGSLPLSPQELRKALKPGKFLQKIDFYCTNSPAIKLLFGEQNIPDPRMRDMDLILRFFVMTKFINDYKGNYKNAVDQVCDFYNGHPELIETDVPKQLDLFENTIKVAVDVFGEEEVFRRKSNSKVEKRINRALFDIICYYFSQIDNQSLMTNSDIIRQMTSLLDSTNASFIKSISSNTNNLKETSTRFVIYGENLQINTGLSVNIPQNLKKHYTKT